VSKDKKYLSIKSWAEEDQPREKLLSKGKKHLSTAELMAILVRTGTKGKSALNLCQEILDDNNHNLDDIGRLEVKDLMQYKGMGEAKAIAVVAALEIGRRRQNTDVKKKPVIRSSQDAFSFIGHRLQDIPFEEFWILMLNRSGRVIEEVKISSGGVSATVVDIRIIMKKAIAALAESIILVHNHPSGNLKPSVQDKTLTRKIQDGAQLFSMKVVDHLIITDNAYFSFADEGLI
jgi:DNA repair protein RadC